MRIRWTWGVLAVMLSTNGGLTMAPNQTPEALPAPLLAGQVALEEAIARRRSVRELRDEPLTMQQIGQLCWAGQGITDRQTGYRAVPSAGALYPIELHIMTAEGVSRYLPKEHALRQHLVGDQRRAVQRAALGQDMIAHAPACLIITAVVERVAVKYRDRAERYCFMEAGHVAQNILLQATALQLAGVPVGAFEDEKMDEVLKLPAGERVLYLVPIGKPR
jgi:SagB-type dehydrogenase family enzyme